MLKRLVLVFVLLSAAPNAQAEAMAWEGTLTLDFVATAIRPAWLTGGGMASVNSSGGGIALVTLALAGGITGAVTVPVSDPDVTASISAITASVALGSGSLGPFQPPASFGVPQLTQRQLPIRGSVRLCLILANCGSSLELPLTRSDGSVGAGVGGMLTIGGIGNPLASIEGAPWTLRTASLAISTGGGHSLLVPRAGFRHGAFSLTGSTALPGGEVQLVSPIAVTALGGDSFSSFAVLSLRFVPEPASFLLLGAGVLGLVVLAQRSHQPPGDSP